MTILLVQIFLLLLGAFLLGAMTACLLRRSLFARPAPRPAPPDTGVSASPPQGADSTRFERALSSDPKAAVPPPFQPRQTPMIEVQPASAAPARSAAAPQVTAPPTHVAVPSSAPPAPSSPPTSRFAGRIATAAPSPHKEAAPSAPAPSPAPAPAPPKQAAPAPVTVAPAAAPPPDEAPDIPADADDLTRIRAIDTKTRKRLGGLGVFYFHDIAAWTADDVARIAKTLGLGSRIDDENWIEQASILTERAGADIAPKAQSKTGPAHHEPERLHRIIGIDPATEALLVANGVTRIADVAAWTGADVEKVEELIGKPGRVGLENWIGQARVLSRAPAQPETRPLHLAAAIREAAAKPAPAAAVPAAAPAAPPASADTTPSAGPRSELDGLRSVRSEALRREPLASTVGAYDDLKRIRGVGVLIEKKLNSLGIATYEQVANWSAADVDRISQVLDFKGRIERESWVEQARILASGGHTEFSRRADRGEMDAARAR